ncbi:uncharacterized protein AB9W97_007827 [Spinachia spinachia]
MERGSFSFYSCVPRTPMKMAAVLAVSVLLLCCSSVSSADSSQKCDYYVETGGTATVPMTLAVDPSDKLTWWRDGSVILRRNKGGFVVGSKDLVTANGSLRLTDVSPSNEGAYRAEVSNSEGKNRGTLKTTRLCALDPVPEPQVTQQPNCDATSEVQFVCAVQPQQAPAQEYAFAWLQKNEVLAGETGRTLTRQVDQVKTDPVACNISNRVSWRTSVEVQRACSSECYPGRPSMARKQPTKQPKGRNGD